MTSCFSFKRNLIKDSALIPKPSINSVNVNDMVYRLAKELEAAWQLDKLFEFQMQYSIKNNFFFFNGIKSKLLNYEKLTTTLPDGSRDELGLTIGVSYVNMDAKKDEELLVRTQVVTYKSDSLQKVVPKIRLEIDCSKIKAKRDDPRLILDILEWIHEQFLLLDSNYKDVFAFACSKVPELENAIKEQICKETSEFYRAKKQKVSHPPSVEVEVISKGPKAI